MPIGARFHTLRDAVLATVDFKFAEPIRVAFYKSGAVDQTRAPFEFEGVLRVGEGKNTSVASGRGEGWRSRIMADKAELHIDPTTYAGPPIKAGDKVRANTRPGAPWFEVSGIDDRSHTRLVLQLTES